MAINKVLKESSDLFKKLENLMNFLNENQLSLHQTVYNGIIVQHKGIEFFKYNMDGQFPEEFPPFIEGKWIKCDGNGNIDFYQED